MNRKWLALVVVACLAGGCATPKAPGGDAGVDLSSSQEVLLTVHGLSCPLCSNNLDGQLRRIEGVEEATIDLKTGAVLVRLGEGHSVLSEALARAVEEAGFTLKRIERTDAAQ